jgi:hypothetical protein
MAVLTARQVLSDGSANSTSNPFENGSQKNKTAKSQNSLKGKVKMSQPIRRVCKKTLTQTRKTQMNKNLKTLSHSQSAIH